MYGGTKACQSDRKIEGHSANSNTTEIVIYYKIQNRINMLNIMNHSMVFITIILLHKHCDQPLSEIFVMFAFS